VSGIRCEDCRRRFGGEWGFKLGHPVTLERCRTVDELKAAGLRRRRGGVWVRMHSRFQVRLLDFRVPNEARVRVWYGKPYRALTEDERSEYRRRLAQEHSRTPSGGNPARSTSASALSGQRNAQSRALSGLRGAA
jgi:hypothetical protein